MVSVVCEYDWRKYCNHSVPGFPNLPGLNVEIKDVTRNPPPESTAALFAGTQLNVSASHEGAMPGSNANPFPGCSTVMRAPSKLNNGTVWSHKNSPDFSGRPSNRTVGLSLAYRSSYNPLLDVHSSCNRPPNVTNALAGIVINVPLWCSNGWACCNINNKCLRLHGIHCVKIFHRASDEARDR
jgi:hypothetical protein